MATGSLDERSVEDLLDRTQAEFGRLDFLVNNAASSRGNDLVPVIEMPVAECDRVIGINLRVRFLMSRAFAQPMVANNWPGCIITISSVAGKSLPPRARHTVPRRLKFKRYQPVWQWNPAPPVSV